MHESSLTAELTPGVRKLTGRGHSAHHFELCIRRRCVHWGDDTPTTAHIASVLSMPAPSEAKDRCGLAYRWSNIQQRCVRRTDVGHRLLHPSVLRPAVVRPPMGPFLWLLIVDAIRSGSDPAHLAGFSCELDCWPLM